MSTSERRAPAPHCCWESPHPGGGALGPEDHSPVYSPRITRDMITVKMGAELFTVSANETATFFRLTRPKTTVANLRIRRRCHWDGGVGSSEAAPLLPLPALLASPVKTLVGPCRAGPAAPTAGRCSAHPVAGPGQEGHHSHTILKLDSRKFWEESECIQIHKTNTICCPKIYTALRTA